MERLVVGSQDAAHDYPVLKELGVTHILNVGYGIPNAFPDVCNRLVSKGFRDVLTCMFSPAGADKIHDRGDV